MGWMRGLFMQWNAKDNYSSNLKSMSKTISPFLIILTMTHMMEFASNAASVSVTWDVIWILVTSTSVSNPRFFNVFLLFLCKRVERSKTSHSLPCIRYKSRQNKGNPAWAGVNGYLGHINKYKFINIPFDCLTTFPSNGARNAYWYLLTWHL
jgi:hypothetical protein